MQLKEGDYYWVLLREDAREWSMSKILIYEGEPYFEIFGDEEGIPLTPKEVFNPQPVKSPIEYRKPISEKQSYDQEKNRWEPK